MKHFAQKSLCCSLALMIFIAGCGGHMANPVERYSPGDENKSCNALKAETEQLDQEIVLKQQEIKKRDGLNIVYFVTGWFIIVPWFFMDVKGSQEVELDALRARKKALSIIYADNGCGEVAVQ